MVRGQRSFRNAALVLAFAASGCAGEELIRVPPPGTKTEVFTQNTVSKVDLLWVVDDSGSMADKQAKLAASFQRFIDQFTRGAIDYRIAVTTTDVGSDKAGARGKFFGTPALVTPSLADPLAAFQKNVRVGTAGSGNEQGLLAAKMALDRVNAENAPVLAARTACIDKCGNDANAARACVEKCQTANSPEFLRPEAYLTVIAVSDDEDNSQSEPQFFARYLDTVKGLGNQGAVTFSAIVGDRAPTCSARTGARYAQVARLTGGLTGSICDQTFDQNLSQLATSVVGLKRHFLLGGTPDLVSMQVRVDLRCDTPRRELAACAQLSDGCAGQSVDTLGMACVPKAATAVAVDAAHPEGFTAGVEYRCEDNGFTFHTDADADAVPGLGAKVTVTYLPAKEASCAAP